MLACCCNDDLCDFTIKVRIVKHQPTKWDQKRNNRRIAKFINVGDLVSFKSRAKKWIEIDYFDQLLGRKASGWVAKKYLKRIGL
jgi:hypothetical protein